MTFRYLVKCNDFSKPPIPLRDQPAMQILKKDAGGRQVWLATEKTPFWGMSCQDWTVIDLSSVCWVDVISVDSNRKCL